jgi:Transposase DDE domain group 1
MLLGATDQQIRLIERFAGYFTDQRAADLVEHRVPSLVGQRAFGIALGYEDLIDHDQLRHDPVMAVLGGKLAGIVNLGCRGMLFVSAARQLRSGNTSACLLCCPLSSQKGGKGRPRSAS